MKFADFEMRLKDGSSYGRQAVLDFGSYHLSIINDGFGCAGGFYEIGVFKSSDGVASTMTELPGITEKGDTIKTLLTEDDVDLIIKKMISITGKEPTQV